MHRLAADAQLDVKIVVHHHLPILQSDRNVAFAQQVPTSQLFRCSCDCVGSESRFIPRVYPSGTSIRKLSRITDVKWLLQEGAQREWQRKLSAKHRRRQCTRQMWQSNSMKSLQNTDGQQVSARSLGSAQSVSTACQNGAKIRER